MEFGKALRAEMNKAGMKVRHLSYHLDVDPATIGCWTSGRKTPSFPRLIRLIQIFPALLDAIKAEADRDSAA